MFTMYGLKNCDTCRKAQAWLARRGGVYQFHDFRAHGLNAELLERLEANLGWETLLNRRSTTWRELPEFERSDLNRDKALALMLAHPVLIKRPILTLGDRVLVGFSATQYAREI